jgi:hypothetical protein
MIFSGFRFRAICMNGHRASCILRGFQGGALALPIDTKLFKSSMYSPRMTDVFSSL